MRSKKSFIELIKESVSEDHPCFKKWFTYLQRDIERGKTIIRKLKVYKIDVSRRVILDVGCGLCGLSIALTNACADVVGLDISKQNIQIAKVRLSEKEKLVNLVLGCGEHIPFKIKSFDLVFCKDVIEHVTNPQICAKEISRVLKNAGFLYIAAPNPISPRYLLCDPHYNLPLITILPRSIAKIYAKVLRRIENYGVNKLPTYPFLINIFKNTGIDLFYLNKDVFDKLRIPMTIKSKIKKWFVYIISKKEVFRKLLIYFVYSFLARGLVFIGAHKKLVNKSRNHKNVLT